MQNFDGDIHRFILANGSENDTVFSRAKRFGNIELVARGVKDERSVRGFRS